MNFACIGNCSICPLYGRINHNSGVKMPVLNAPDSIIPVEEYDEKENTAIQTSQEMDPEPVFTASGVDNLPAVQEVQYSVTDVAEKRKKLFKRGK